MTLKENKNSVQLGTTRSHRKPQTLMMFDDVKLTKILDTSITCGITENALQLH